MRKDLQVSEILLDVSQHWKHCIVSTVAVCVY